MLRTTLLLLLTLAPAAGAAPAQDFRDEEPLEIANHAVPVNRTTTALVRRAEEHLSAGRWEEGLSDLQELLEDHPRELLDRARPLGSLQDVFPGVSVWARQRLAALPPDVQALYREKHGARARRALERARERADLAALTGVAARWPLCEATATAWWSVGDIELERGNVHEARAAWLRALAADLDLASLGLSQRELSDPGQLSEHLATREAEGLALPAGVRARLELVATLSAQGDNALPRRARQSELELPGPGEGARGLPGEEASTWARPVELPDHPFAGPGMTINLFPVRQGDALLVSTSLSLLCVDAYAGTVRWRSAEPAGWERLSQRSRQEFFQGIDAQDALIAPAASDTIAVAALQVPVSQTRNENFNNIPITTVIPDRRLFAFDLETGAPLWDHAPPLDWDGESGDFETRMRVAGPPVIAAARIFVPVYRLQGRIDLHVACYELATGALVWSTPVISGQRSLNMFNRPQWEYCAPPLLIEGDRVIALTQLGTVAALDFFSGALLWETRYDQVPIRNRRSPRAVARDATWRNAAPVIAAGVVVATPVDGDHLLGVDLETGAMLWQMRQSECNRLADGRGSGTEVDLLLGADEHRVYLGGQRFIALESVAGLPNERPDTAGWRLDDGFYVQERTPARPVLAADRIVVPTPSQRIEVDRHNGLRVRPPIAWRGDLGGNLLLGDGMMFTLSAHQLNAYFEWDLLLSRARADLRALPGDDQAALRLAALLAERGRSERDAGRSERARQWLDDAREVLAPALEGGGPDLSAEMHALLRTRAQVRVDLADGRGALSDLRRARELAPGRPELRDTLLEELELLRLLVDEEAFGALLGELEVACGDLWMAAELAPGPAGADTSPAARAAAVAYAGPGLSAWRLRPLAGRTADDPMAVRQVPVALWVELERADLAARAGDLGLELEALHRAIELWPDQKLPGGTAREVAAARVGALLELRGRAAYAPFEERARELAERALAERDARRLEQVPALYPHSLAAREANDALLDWALEADDVEAAARIALEELPERWSPVRANEREARLLLRLSGALAAGGNAAYLDAAVARLARARPGLASPLEVHGGRQLSELVRPPTGAPPDPPEHAFALDCAPGAVHAGGHTLLGLVPPARTGAARDAELLVFACEQNVPQSRTGRQVHLAAFGSADPSQPAWIEPLDDENARSDWRHRAAVTPGLALVATRRDVIAFERDGAPEPGRAARRFTWPAREGEIESLFVDAGVALVIVSRPGQHYRLYGLDVETGAELWRTDLAHDEYSHAPVVGAARAVFLPGGADERAVVFDVLTGRRTLEIELPPIRRHDAQGSWIEDGRLIVPGFEAVRTPERNEVLCVDLDTGNPLWRVPLGSAGGGDYVLRSVVRQPTATFLVLQRATTYAAEGPPGLLLDLRTTLGITGQIAELAEGYDLVGVPRLETVDLDAPLLFLRSSSAGDREVRVHAMQLPYGNERWTRRLPIPREQLYESASPPLPAAGASAVALVLSEKSPRDGYDTSLYMLDRYTGARGPNFLLDRELGRASQVRVHALGDALLVAGQNLLQVMR